MVSGEARQLTLLTNLRCFHLEIENGSELKLSNLINRVWINKTLSLQHFSLREEKKLKLLKSLGFAKRNYRKLVRESKINK